jgi:HAD superfamily hydrolase (TIGR01458 family)
MLDNVRGLLLDIDGVLHVGMQPIPGAAETLRALFDAGLSYRLVTNTTTASRATLGKSLRKIGLPVRDGDLITAPVATAAYLHRQYPDARCYLIAKGDVAADFRAAGLTLVGDKDEAADVVVIGGAEERLTYERLNRAFRMVMGGARLVAMHRNRFWRTADGLALDSGPFVGALEEAAGIKAVTVGKPALPFFRQALRDLALPPHQVLVVGDDAANDLAPARRLGCRTLLVRTGKPVGDREASQADFVLDSIADLPPLLC